MTFGNRGEGTMCMIYEVAGPKMDIGHHQCSSAIKSIQILRNLIFAVFLIGEMLVAVILTAFATVQCAFS